METKGFGGFNGLKKGYKVVINGGKRFVKALKRASIASLGALFSFKTA